MASFLRKLLGSGVSRLSPRFRGPMVNVLRIDAGLEEDDDVQEQLDSMEDLLPETITPDLFQSHLNAYPNYIHSVYQGEEMLQLGIPRILEERTKGQELPFLTKEELSQIFSLIRYLSPITHP